MFYRNYLLSTAVFLFLATSVDIAFAMEEKQKDETFNELSQKNDNNLSSGDESDSGDESGSGDEAGTKDQDDNIVNLVQKGQAIPVAIIGAGMAGLTAAKNLHRDGFNPVVFMGPRPKGTLSSPAIVTQNFPGGSSYGSDVTESKFKAALEEGVHMVEANIKKVEIPTQGKNYFTLTTHTNQIIKAASVIFAMGSYLRPLDRSVENLDTYEGKIWGENVWTQSENYQRAVNGKNVVIIGSAVDALNKSLLALNGKAASITFLVRSGEIRSSVALPNPKIVLQTLHDRAKRLGAKITIEYNTVLKAINGNGNEITNIIIKDNTGKERELPADILVNATGRVPNTSFLPNDIKKLQDKRIWVNCLSMETNIPGAFAAGEIISDGMGKMPPMAGQGDMAIGTGAFAAQGAISYLRSIGIEPAGIPHTGFLTHPYEPNIYSDLNTLKTFLRNAAKKHKPVDTGIELGNSTPPTGN